MRQDPRICPSKIRSKLLVIAFKGKLAGESRCLYKISRLGILKGASQNGSL